MFKFFTSFFRSEFFDEFHLSGWYNLASLRKVVLTSLTEEDKLIPKTLKGLSENKELGERGERGGGGEGGGGGDWGRRELLESRLFLSGLVSGLVSVLQGSGSNLWRLLTRKDQWIKLCAT